VCAGVWQRGMCGEATYARQSVVAGRGVLSTQASEYEALFASTVEAAVVAGRAA